MRGGSDGRTMPNGPALARRKMNETLSRTRDPKVARFGPEQARLFP
jgi:hypothetical protein